MKTNDQRFLCNVKVGGEDIIETRQTIAPPLQIADCSFHLEHNCSDSSYSLKAVKTGLYLSDEGTKIQAVDQSVDTSSKFTFEIDNGYVTIETETGFWKHGLDNVLQVGNSNTVPAARFKVSSILTQFGRYEPATI